jgi:predicted ester cyclase
MALLTSQEIVRLYGEMYETGDSSIADAIIAEDFIDHSHPEMPRGPEGVKHMLQRTNRAFTDISVRRTHMLFDGELVAFRFILSATHSGPLGTIPASGKRIALEGMDLIRIAGGKMIELWSCQNTFEVLRQMGCELSVPPTA